MTPQETQDVARELRSLYPALGSLGDAALEAVLDRVQLLRVPAGTPMFGEGSPCRQFPLVLEGSIRVAKSSEGRELQLYRVMPGESCVLTGGCLVGGRDYPATGVVEQDARLVVLPKPVFDELLATHAPFRQYVFSLFAERLTELMALVEAVAFHKLDRRLAAALLGHGRLVAHDASATGRRGRQRARDRDPGAAQLRRPGTRQVEPRLGRGARRRRVAQGGGGDLRLGDLGY